MFFRVLSAESLKLKRTLALRMALIAPMVMTLLQIPVSAKGARLFIAGGKDAWTPMILQTIQIWTLLMMPLFVALETALLAGLENTGNNWKGLLALPAPRWTVYVCKLVVAIGLLWAAHAVLFVGTIGAGMFLKLLYPALQLEMMPLSTFVAPMLRVSVAALLAVAIQHWISLRWSSYTVAMGFGMCAMIINIFAFQSNRFGSWFPWTLPIRAVLNGVAAQDRTTPEAVLVATVVATMGCWAFVRRDIG